MTTERTLSGQLVPTVRSMVLVTSGGADRCHASAGRSFVTMGVTSVRPVDRWQGKPSADTFNEASRTSHSAHLDPIASLG